MGTLDSLSLTRSFSIPGDRDKIGGVVFKMLEKKREYHLGSGDLLRFRVCTALGNSAMQGLTHHKTQEEAPTSVAPFLALYRFESALEEENRGSGYKPLALQPSRESAGRS